MSEIIVSCPQCQRQLRVPEDLLGKKVKCPACAMVFTADGPGESLRATPLSEVTERPPPAYHAQAVPLGEVFEDASGTPGSRQARPEEEDYDYRGFDEQRHPGRRRFGRNYSPHRGALILTLGILSLVICGFLGPFAWVMGNTDLAEIRAGRMDPEGEGLTQAGRICGMIASILLIIGCTCYGFLILAGMGGRFR